jgi:DNA-binding MarR family transcriptional regulator
MTTHLQQELRQNRPFRNPRQEALLSIERTAALLGHALAEGLRPWGVTPTQYNVLRILRGGGESGLCRHQIRDRMVTPVPDVTRLLDRLEEAGLVRRWRSTADRRQVRTQITAPGLELLADLDPVVDELEAEQIGHVPDDDLRKLIRLLEHVRAREAARV